MIPFDEARRIALDAARPLMTESVPLSAARGRVLAEDVVADMPMPPFDKAIVDGYACRRADLDAPLSCVDVVAAGQRPEKPIGPGECAKIMTGAPVPEGADCVFLVEHSEPAKDGRVRWTGDRTNDNIARRGTDIEAGAHLIRAGHLIQPADVAVLASMGYAEPRVYAKPRVAVVSTGDELVEPSSKPGPVQIRNSNGPQTCAQLETMGIQAVYGGIARDSEEHLRNALGLAFESSDLILLSGGVSMGDYDYVPAILRENGVTIHFDKVAVQPGKPTVFGSSETAYCFGLPGNPVSAYAIFELFVRPFLYRLMGHDYTPPTVVAPLAETFTRKVGTREAYVPVRLDEEGRVARIDYHGSAHINAFVHADGMIAFPVGVTEMAAGSAVTVRLLRH